MFIGCFGLHHGYLLYLTLQDQKPVVIQINAVAAKELRYFFELHTPTIHSIE
jgi:hypothetical protein